MVPQSGNLHLSGEGVCGTSSPSSQHKKCPQHLALMWITQIQASTKGTFMQDTPWLFEDLLDQVDPGWDPCLGDSRGSGFRSPVGVLTARIFGLLICLSGHQENAKLWLSSGATTFFHSQETFFTLSGYKTISHSIPQAWNKRKKIKLKGLGTVPNFSVYCALEFWFSPLQRDETSTGSEWDALRDETTVVPELGAGHAAETRNTKSTNSLTPGI